MRGKQMMGEKTGFEVSGGSFHERTGRRRISEIYETDNFQTANNKLHDGWDLLKAIVSNRRGFYILVRYEEEAARAEQEVIPPG